MADNSGAAEGNSALYGGAGNDTMLALAAGGDSMAGGTGVNLFVANDQFTNNFGLDGNFFTVNDMITVEDYNASINDYVSMSSRFFGNNDFGEPGFLFKQHIGCYRYQGCRQRQHHGVYSSKVKCVQVQSYGVRGIG